MIESIIYPAILPTHGQPVLVSGAGFAGLATAWWLNQLGHHVVIVEAAKALRRGGTPVDIEGETIDVLTRMGLIKAVRAKALPPRAMEFKDENDVTLAAIDAEDPATQTRYEIHRDDLLDILAGALPDDVELLFGRSVEQLAAGPNGVSVTFTDGSQREFALMFGCDGARSNTRRLVFGAGDEFTYFMGGYFFLKVVHQTGLLPANRTQVFSVPGHTALLNGYDDRTDIGFGFRTEREIKYDHRDRAQQRRLIHAHFDDLGWKVPAMLASMKGDDDFYFDRINQIRMPCWSRGRVVLVGDAGYCVSPLAGFGGSMAIIGAGRLADSLKRYPDDHITAFRHYESGLRSFVEDVQERAATSGLEMMFPADDAEFAERDRKLAEGEIDL